jgi:hypothetical protein
MSQPAHERLAAAMDARRLVMRAKWGDIAQAAQMSTEALRAIRRGDYRPKDLTARRLDEAFGWEEGTVEAILDGTLTGQESHLRGNPAATTRAVVDDLQAEVDRLMGRLPAARRERIERMIRDEEAELERLRVVALRRWRDLLESD